MAQSQLQTQTSQRRLHSEPQIALVPLAENTAAGSLLPPAGQPRSLPRVARRCVIAVTLLTAAAFWALHLLHLRADFPDHSPWMDWAKYTDEGWYGDAAVRHFERGSWYVPGDFNPAAALPVFPLLEAAVFRVAGVGVVQARALSVAIFGLILCAAFALVRRARLPGHRAPFAGSRRSPTLAAAIAVLLLAVSPFCYAFMRMAILEPLLDLLMLLALLAAEAAPPEGIRLRTPARRALPVLALGLLLPAMVLTKTTALFLFPAVFFLVWARGNLRLRPLLRNGGAAAAVAVALWLTYFLVLVRPRYLTDYRYLFSANAYTGITLETAATVLVETVRDTAWIGRISPVFALALLISAAALLLDPIGRLRRHRIAVSLALWLLGYAAFLAYHSNLQPRYYLVLAVPITLFTPLAWEQLFHRARLWPTRARIAGRLIAALGACALLALAVGDARETLTYIRSPQYAFYNAARQIAAITRADPTRNPLVLSISGSDLSLMAGIPSICDDFGTMELADRVAAYHPGWYAAWNQVDDDKMDALSPLYHLRRVAAFPAMDDPERNLLILYRLDPPTGEHRPRRRRGSLPRRLQTRVGQQPSVTQLEH